MHLSHLVTMPFFRAACSNFLYIQPCLSDCTHQCGWFLSFQGLVLIVQYLANEGGKIDPKHPPHQLKNRESLVQTGITSWGNCCDEPFHVHKGAPSTSPRGEPSEALGSLTNHSIIKQKTTTLNDYNTHQKTHPANLQHKAIHFRALMNSTIAVKRKFTTNSKAKWTGGATLQTYQLENNNNGRIKSLPYILERRREYELGLSVFYFFFPSLKLNKGSSSVGGPEFFLTSIAPLIPEYTISSCCMQLCLLFKSTHHKMFSLFKHKSLHFNVIQF